MNNLKSFRIGEAFYFLENLQGSKLRIVINYAKNDFKLVVITDRGEIELLKTQAGVAAKHMLGKKARKNLVEKLLQLKVNQ